jgi:hypothetical protein
MPVTSTPANAPLSPSTPMVEEGAEMTTATQRAGIAALTGKSAGWLRQRLRDYVTLTKPRIISLLLVTTLAPMIIAARGWPDGWVVLWTMVGGYLMAGGANAINMFIDRDIDSRMVRTSLRPIPSGRMSPAHVLGFGVALGAAAFALFASKVNLLSGVLALAGPPLLRLRLHALAQAYQPAEHRDRRRRRRLSAAGRVGGGDGERRPHRRLSLPDRLLLDPAALLGAGAREAEGLRACGGADGAERLGVSGRRSGR